MGKTIDDDDGKASDSESDEMPTLWSESEDDDEEDIIPKADLIHPKIIIGYACNIINCQI